MSVAPKLSERNFAPAAPNQVWSGDLSCIVTAEGWPCLTVVLDLINRKIVGWSIKLRMTAGIVIDAQTMVWSRRKPASSLVHHLDRESQYANHASQAHLEEYGMGCSNGLKGNCWDNSPTESVGDRMLADAPDQFSSHALSESDRITAPMFSVIVPTKNRPALIRDALDSLAAQTCKDFEIVVANDGGDNIADIIAQFQQRGLSIQYLWLDASRGPAGARNAALCRARGRYVTYLDDDDLYHPDHLDRLAAAAAVRPDAFHYTWARYVLVGDTTGQRADVAVGEPYRNDEFKRDELFAHNYIPTPTWCHPRRLIDQIGGFDETLTILEDWDFLIRAALACEFQPLPHCTVTVRHDPARGDHASVHHYIDPVEAHHRIHRRYAVHDNDRIRQLKALVVEQLTAHVAAGSVRGCDADANGLKTQESSMTETSPPQVVKRRSLILRVLMAAIGARAAKGDRKGRAGR